MILSVLLIVFGALFLWRNISCIRNEENLREYLQTSPKAKLWVSSLGMERTVKISKVIFLPLGVIASVCMVIAGFIEALI